MTPPKPQQDILVIDDNPNNLGVLSELLREHGYRVRVANNGRRGLEAAHQLRPDLIMLDITMPDMDGFEVCAALKADADMAPVPVIFLSAREEVLDKQTAFSVGGADYVQKPFQVQEVLMRARYQLNLAALQEEVLTEKKHLEEANERLEENAGVIQNALLEAKALNRELLAMNGKLQASQETQSQFLAKMRHEINNPLSSILGLAEQLHQGGLSEEQSHALSAFIKAETFHLDFQIRNIFAAADLEAGLATPTITQVDVDSVLNNVLDAFSLEAIAKSVKILRPGPPAQPPLVFPTDAGMLRTIVANLLANAIAFSPTGAEVSLWATEEGGTLVLAIQDQGVGVKEADQTVIFDRFKQLEDGSLRTQRGQGLGLPVAKALAELMAGTLDVQSQPGQVTVFTCRLPRFTAMDDSNTSSYEGNLFIFDNPEVL